MATGGPYKPFTMDTGEEAPALPIDRSITGLTDAEIAQGLGAFGENYQQDLPGIMSQDRIPAGAIERAVTQANQQLNPNSLGTTPTTTTTRQQVDPTANNAGGGLSLRVNPANFGRSISNQDIVPHPDPRTVTHDGHSFSMPAFQIGGDMLAERGQQIAKERAAVREAMAKAMGAGDEAKSAKVPTQYVRSYQNLWNQSQNEFLQSEVAKWGTEERAWEKIAHPTKFDPATRRKWMQLGKNLDAIGQVIDGDFKEAELYLDGVNKGQYRYAPEAIRATQDLIRGYSQLGQQGLGDVNKLMEANNEYRKYVTPEAFFHDNHVDDIVKDHMGRTYGPIEFDNRGRMVVATWEDKKTAEKYIEQLADEYYPMFQDMWNKDEFREYLKARYPTQVELKVQMRAKPKASSSKSSSEKEKVLIGDVEVGLSANYPDNTPTKKPTPVYRVPLSAVIDGRPELMKQKDFRRSDGSRVNLIPTHLALSDLDGKLYIEGENAAVDELDTEAKKLELDIQNKNSALNALVKAGKSKEKIAEATRERDALIDELDLKKKRKKDDKVPYNGNEKTFALFVGEEEAEAAKAKAIAARDADTMRRKPSEEKIGTRRKDASGQEWERVKGGWKAL